MNDIMKLIGIVGGAVGAGLAFGAMDKEARAESDARREKERDKEAAREQQKRAHERYIMDHPDEYGYVKDYNEREQLKQERDKWRNNYNSVNSSYKNKCASYDRLQKQKAKELSDKDAEITAAKAERDDLRDKLKRVLGVEDIPTDTNSNMDMSEVKRVLDTFDFDSNKMEALKVMFGKD